MEFDITWRRAETHRGGQGRGKADTFSSINFHTKKVKSLVFKLKKTPMFGPWGGRPVRPYLDLPV